MSSGALENSVNEVPIAFRRHPVRWSPEKIARFWAWLSSSQPDERYFSHTTGAAIVRFARQRRVLRGPALDFGCGRGFLIEHLLDAGVHTFGVDVSAESLEATEERLHGRVGYLGTRCLVAGFAPLPAETFETVFLIETVEHLDDENLTAVLSEIHRLLRPQGALVITTPNTERLADNFVMCPDCGCEFHRMQHVRSFDERTLRMVVEGAGFRVAAAECRNLRSRPRVERVRRIVRRLVRRPMSAGPHLLLVAKRAAGSAPVAAR